PSVAADVLQHGRVTHVTVVPGAGSSDRQDDPGARPVDAVTGCRTEDAVARVAVRARVHTALVHDPLAGGGVAHDRGRVVVALMGEVEALVRHVQRRVGTGWQQPRDGRGGQHRKENALHLAPGRPPWPVEVSGRVVANGTDAAFVRLWPARAISCVRLPSQGPLL